MSAFETLTRSLTSARGGALGMLQTALTQILVMAVNVVTGVITARLLGPHGRGEYAAASIWLLLPASLATAGLQSGLVYLARRDPAEAGSIGVAGLLLGGLVYLPIGLACLLLMPLLMHAYSSTAIMLARGAILASSLSVCMLLARQSLLGTRRVHLFNLSSAGSPTIYLCVLLVLLPFSTLTPITAIAAQVAATLVVLVPTLWWAAENWRWLDLKPLAAVRLLAPYSARASGIDVVNVFYLNVDRLMLIGLITPEQLGLYAVASSFARLVAIMQTATSSVTLADLANRPAAEIEQYIHRMIRVLFWLLLIACCVGWLSGSVLVRLFYGVSFAPAAPIFRILLVDSSLACLSQVLVEAYLAAGKPNYPTIIQVAYCGMLSIGLMVAAPLWGGVGAATAMVVAISAKIILLLVGLRRIGLRPPSLWPDAADMGWLRRFGRGHAP